MAYDGFLGQASTPDLDYIEGISATIRFEEAALCSSTGLGNTSSVWALIGENHNHATARGVGGGLTQVGYIVDPAHLHPTYFFEAGTSDSGFPQFWHAGVTHPIGDVHRYSVDWTTGCPLTPGVPCFAMLVDSTIIAYTLFNPYTFWGYPDSSNRWQTQMSGETHYNASDMPGRPTGGIATVFDQPEVQSSIDDTFSVAPCTYPSYVQSSRYGLNSPTAKGCVAWSIYTN